MAKKLNCPKCSRTFSMPAHLARHLKTTHAPGGAAKKSVAAKANRKVGRPKGSGKRAKKRAMVMAPSGGGTDSLIAQAKAHVADLLKQRDAINNEIAAVNAAMKALRKA